MPEFKHADTPAAIEACFAVLQQLRPKLVAKDFVEQVSAMLREGYKLAYLQEGDKVVAAAGYRMYTNLFMGKHLYVDDLVTDADERSKGYGGEILEKIRDIARAEGCKVFHLDSGTQRPAAHKFYFAAGLSIASFHFSENLE